MSDSKPCRAASGSVSSKTGMASAYAANSGSITSSPPPAHAVYFGCIRMPASMRIDSALM